MLNVQGSPATADAGDYGGDNEASCLPGHPMMPAINEPLHNAEAAVPNRPMPHVAPRPMAIHGIPDAVAELVATDESINVLMVETRDAKQCQLPPKDSAASWRMLTHRVTMELD